MHSGSSPLYCCPGRRTHGWGYSLVAGIWWRVRCLRWAHVRFAVHRAMAYCILRPTPGKRSALVASFPARDTLIQLFGATLWMDSMFLGVSMEVVSSVVPARVLRTWSLVRQVLHREAPFKTNAKAAIALMIFIFIDGRRERWGWMHKDFETVFWRCLQKNDASMILWQTGEHFMCSLLPYCNFWST